MDDQTSQYLQRRNAGAAAADRAALLSILDEYEPDSAPEPAPTEQPAESGGVLKDIGTGLVEAPRATVHGVVDAANEIADLVGSVGQWVEDAVGTGGVEVGPDGFRILSHEELQAKRAKGEAIADLRVPNVPAPESVTGNLFENAAQFIAGFGAVGKVAKVAGIATKAAPAVRAGAQGAAADFAAFDPHEARLSNLIQSSPALANPVNAYLAADPSDGEAEGRLKNALEGVGLGIAVEGVVRGLRAVRKAREAKIAAGADAEFHAEPDLSLLGDEMKPPIAEAADVTPGKVEINFATINTDDDVKALMQTLADRRASEIVDEQRGVRSWSETRLAGAQLDAWNTLQARRTGETLNAEQTLAARELWVRSAEKVHEIATAAAKAPNETNLVMFRRMLATHSAVQKAVLGARTEAGRALDAWRIPAGSGRIKAQALAGLLEQNGGREVSEKLAQRVAALADAGMYRELDKFIEQGAWARTSSAVAQVWINSMLSAPATHLVNAMSNWSVVGLTLGERRIASHLSRLMGAENGVEAGEAVYMTFGLVQGIRDALRVSAKGAAVLAHSAAATARGDRGAAARLLADNAGEFGTVYRSAATGKSGYGVGKVEGRAAGGSLSAEAWDVASGTWLGRGLDLLDTVTSAPGRALTVSDEFFKTIGYRMELNARALRQATQEVREGKLAGDSIKSRVAKLIENPPEDLQLAAVDAAAYQTFTGKPPAVLKAAADGIQQVPILGRVVLPFKNTLLNVAAYSFERTPFAPLLASWRADIAAGGARADLAMARTGLGTALMLGGIDLAMSDVITGAGPSDPAQLQHLRRTGWQPYSVKVGDTYYSYNRLDPLGMTLALAADTAEMMINSAADEKDIEKVIQAGTLAIASSVTSETYAQGIAQLFDAVSDPDRYGEAWFNKLAGTIVPSGVAAVARMEDPFLREANSMVDAIKRRTPGQSEGLPLVRDLWGRPVDFRSGYGAAFDFLSPVYVKRENPEPIDKELERLGYYPAMPRKAFSYKGVSIDLRSQPGAYSRYVELAGNEAKDPIFGMGAKDTLNGLIDGKHPLAAIYSVLSDEKKEAYIEGKLADFRKLARETLMREVPALMVQYETKRAAAQRL